MQYTARQIQMIVQKIFSKIQHELEIAQRNDTVDELMDKYGVSLEEESVMVDKHTSKILVIGALAGKKDNFVKAARKMDISQYNIQFVDDYEKLTNFNATRLRNSFVYSDIICGPMPHSMKNKEGSSLIAEMKNNPAEYPRVIVANANSGIKLSIHSFIEALSRTRYFESLTY